MTLLEEKEHLLSSWELPGINDEISRDGNAPSRKMRLQTYPCSL